MNCIAIDDEPMALDIVSDYCQKFPFVNLLATFRNAIKAIIYLENNQVDLIFLDINMPDLTGIQFLKSIKTRPMVIFTTAYPDYALNSYEYDAIDYLLKPIEFERFLKAVMKAKEQFAMLAIPVENRKSIITATMPSAGVDDSILIKSGQEIHRIMLNEILYIEGSGNYLTFVTEKKRVMALMNLKSVCEKLPSDQYVRIHKSYIVPLSKLDIIERHQVKINDISLPVGASYRDRFLQMINRQL